MEWGRIIDDIENTTGRSVVKAVGCRSQYVSDLRSGKSKNPGADFVLKLIDEFNLSAHWLLTGEGEMFNSSPADDDDGLLSLPLLKAELASTDLCDEANVESYVKPLRLITQSSAAKIFAVQSLDWQMCGVGISLGDTIFFDAATCNDRADNIYCVALNGKIFCKWLCFGQDEVRVYSIDTSAHSEKQPFGNFGADSGFMVLGRVVAWLHKNHIIYAD